MTAPGIGRGGQEPRLHRDAFGRLVLEGPDGSPVAGVVPVRCFPFSAPGEQVALCDPAGRELACIPELAALPDGTRELVEAELARREFVPSILRILSVEPAWDPSVWHVDADRGETRFTLPGDDGVRRLKAGGVLVTDADGIRYRIPDEKGLDRLSRKLLSRYL